MTGFSRTTGTFNSKIQGETTWSIEIRSVNGKGLDIRLRMPNSLEPIEAELRSYLSKQLKRGNITINIILKNQEARGRIELNKDAFEDVLNAAKTASKISNLPLPALDSLLSMRAVLQEQETLEDEKETSAMQKSLLRDVKEAIDALVTARSEEGSNLVIILNDRLKQITKLVKEAEKLAHDQPQMIKTKLEDNIKKHLEDREELDPQRLHQEAVLITVKADVSEELDRLKAHVEQAETLLNSNKPIGRRLDFLCQEFNREANTLCSKSQSKDLTYVGLELKTIIDQLREQVQNIE